MATQTEKKQTQNPAQNPAAGADGKPARKKRERKQTAARMAAEIAYKNASSEQEKTAARGHLKVVRFRDLASPRVNRLLKAIASVENLANRNAYTWSEEEANKIINAVANGMKSLVDKLQGQKGTKEKFEL